MSATLNTTNGYKGLLPESVLGELLRELNCRRVTGTATLVLTVNQGGVTSASFGIQDRHKTA